MEGGYIMTPAYPYFSMRGWVGWLFGKFKIMTNLLFIKDIVYKEMIDYIYHKLMFLLGT